MHFPASFVVFFGLLAPLASHVLAATLFRGDSRDPATIRSGGGFKSRGLENPLGPQGTLFEHVEGELDDDNRDPFISTSSDEGVAKGFTPAGYVYHVDSTKIHHDLYDVAGEYAKEGREYPLAEEREFAVRDMIPWEAVTKVQRKVKGVWRDVAFRKRGMAFVEETVEA